jgi:hypothetical protein
MDFKRLQDIPVELNDLFKNIIMGDNQNMEGLLLCIQWILYSKKPLKQEEFYFAILSSQDPESLGAWDPDNFSLSDMERFIPSTSKGLAETTRTACCKQ